MEPLNNHQEVKIELENLGSSVQIPFSGLATLQKIDFIRYIDPFIRLLDNVRKLVLIASICLIDSTFTMLKSYQIIFYRLFNAPEYDPAHPSFKEKIVNIQTQLPQFKARIESLKEKAVWPDYTITQNLKEWKDLDSEISKTWSELKRYITIEEGYSQRLPVFEQLVVLEKEYSDLHQQLTIYCELKAESIVQQLISIVDLVTKKGEVVLTEGICKELIGNLEILKEILQNHLSPSHFFNVKTELENLIYQKIQTISLHQTLSQRTHLTEPLPLKNIGNSCYMDSVLQALLCSSNICEQFKQPLVLESPSSLTEEQNKKIVNEYQRKLAIQKEIVKFLSVQQIEQSVEVKAQTDLEFILSLFEHPNQVSKPSLYALRKALFDSGLQGELVINKPEDLTDQYDAAPVMQMFVREFLFGCHFERREHVETLEPEDFPGLRLINRCEMIHVLPVSLREKPENQTLEMTLRFVLDRHMEYNERKFNPLVKDDKLEGKKGLHIEVIAAEQNQGNCSLQLPEKTLSEYIQSYRIQALPSVLVLQFGRYSDYKEGRYNKNPSPLILPSDGTIDFSRYSDNPQDVGNSLFKVKSYVVHNGHYPSSGHYTAYVEIEGKYYYCDDFDPSFYQEITREQFLGHQDAYLLVLERLTSTQSAKTFPLHKSEAKLTSFFKENKVSDNVIQGENS